MYTAWLPDPDATARLGQGLASAIRRAFPPEGLTLWLRGPLGAGKTGVAQGIAAGLGVVGPVPSPTFILVAEYLDARPPIQHVDLYRLTRADEAENLGIADQIPGGYLWLVEWPERAPELWPADRLELDLELEASGRSARIVATGPNSARVLALVEPAC